MSRLEIQVLKLLDKLSADQWYTPDRTATRDVCVRLHSSGHLLRECGKYRVDRKSPIFQQAKGLGII